ncbi:MAG: glutathione S-transferase C-terminal domain-containing protein, partial [Alphaproteobacteria bacterium]|nr:glutathione S-transferase C-terminal domain-containing protein [Alphaproteobacteria bacterium]
NDKMALLEQQLTQTGAYVAGEEFTLADILIGLSVHRWQMTPMERPPYPAIAAYYQRLSQHAGFKTFALDGHD